MCALGLGSAEGLRDGIDDARDHCLPCGGSPRWLGLAKRFHGYDGRHGLTTSTGLGTDGKRAVLALLFGAAAKRLGCGPTCVVLTWAAGRVEAGMKAAYPVGRDKGPWDEERRAGAVFEGMLCEIRRSVSASSPGSGGGVQSPGMGPLLLLVLLRMLIVAMSLGWGRGMCRGGSGLERMLRSKNSAKESLCDGVLELNIALCHATDIPMYQQRDRAA